MMSIREFFCLHRKFLVYNWVARNIKVKYRRSFLGFFWTVLAPLLQVGVFYFVFKIILKISDDNYLPNLTAGIMLWTFFSQTINENLTSLFDQQNLLTKISLPIHLFPLVGTVTNLINLIFSWGIVLVVCVLGGIHFTPWVLFLPVYFALLFLFTYALSILVSLAYCYFRDLRYLMGILLQVWFYATPIVYSESRVPEDLRFLLTLNPTSALILEPKRILVEGMSPDPASLIVSVSWTLFFLLLANLCVSRIGPKVIERL